MIAYQDVGRRISPDQFDFREAKVHRASKRQHESSQGAVEGCSGHQECLQVAGYQKLRQLLKTLGYPRRQ